MKQNDFKSSLSQRGGAPAECAKKNPRETAKPLTELCEVYDYPIEGALMAVASRRLNALANKDGVFYCKTRVFRSFLEEEYNEGKYKKTKVCDDCKKELPLFCFAYHGEGRLFGRCRECHHKYQINWKKGRYSADSVEDEISEEDIERADCRIYKSSMDFIGGNFTVETKKDGELIEFLSMNVEAVIPDSDGATITLVGKDKDGKVAVQRLLQAEVQSLCYEGLSIFWSEKSERLYKKVLILNDN